MTRRRLLKTAAAGLGTSLLQGILATVVVASNVTAQTLIEIRRSPADVAAAGIKLVAANATEYAATLHFVEGVVFHDFSYVGSENLLTFIQRGRPEVHR